MKNDDLTKRYRTRFILNILISAFIVCIAESLLIFYIGRLVKSVAGGDRSLSWIEVYPEAVMLLMVILGAGVFAVSFYLLEKRTLNYINSICEGVSALAAGNFDNHLDVTGDDEFSQMAEDINAMADKLKVLLEHEREAEKSRNDLITNIAHDLRTPLTSVIGYLELLTGKSGVKLSGEQQEKYLDIAFRKSKRLEQLINDLFSYTRMTFGKMTMKPGYVDLVKLLAQLVEDSYPAFVKNGLSYELRSNVDRLEIMADATLIARLFENLIGNAVKYGADGKRITVRVVADEAADIAEVQVINYGFVIQEKDLPHLFEKFYRADAARSTSTGGTGLGLAISKEIAEMHGGSISVTSDLNGTVFIVRLKIHFDKEAEQLTRA